jgi:hypothetical protein
MNLNEIEQIGAIDVLILKALVQGNYQGTRKKLAERVVNLCRIHGLEPLGKTTFYGRLVFLSRIGLLETRGRQEVLYMVPLRNEKVVLNFLGAVFSLLDVIPGTDERSQRVDAENFLGGV